MSSGLDAGGYMAQVVREFLTLRYCYHVKLSGVRACLKGEASPRVWISGQDDLGLFQERVLRIAGRSWGDGGSRGVGTLQFFSASIWISVHCSECACSLAAEGCGYLGRKSAQVARCILVSTANLPRPDNPSNSGFCCLQPTEIAADCRAFHVPVAPVQSTRGPDQNSVSTRPMMVQPTMA
jgi:hypothetical protein